MAIPVAKLVVVPKAGNLPIARPPVREPAIVKRPPPKPGEPEIIDQGGKQDASDPDGGRWIIVENASTNVAAFRWDAKTKELFVNFTPKHNSPASGYVYRAVPLSVYNAFKLAPSYGEFVWKSLRDKYPYDKLF